jgi:hypothetical protein
LHALFVDDDGATPVSASSATLVSGNDVIGSELAGYTVIFPKTSAAVTYTISKGGTTMHLVTGLAPGATVSFSIGGSQKAQTQVGPGGCATASLTTKAGDVVSVE